jgi:hypothetical protein
MEVVINNNIEMLSFIKRKDVNFALATQVVEVYLKVLILDNKNKEKLIADVENHFKKFGDLPSHWERPLFLDLELDVLE